MQRWAESAGSYAKITGRTAKAPSYPPGPDLSSAPGLCHGRVPGTVLRAKAIMGCQGASFRSAGQATSLGGGGLQPG